MIGLKQGEWLRDSKSGLTDLGKRCGYAFMSVLQRGRGEGPSLGGRRGATHMCLSLRVPTSRPVHSSVGSAINRISVVLSLRVNFKALHPVT